MIEFLVDILALLWQRRDIQEGSADFIYFQAGGQCSVGTPYDHLLS